MFHYPCATKSGNVHTYSMYKKKHKKFIAILQHHMSPSCLILFWHCVNIVLVLL